MSKKVEGFKYFVKLTKAYQENGGWYVEGVASGTLEDRDEQRMNLTVLQQFVEAMPLPLTNSHPRTGDVLGEMGEIVEAIILEDMDNSLFIKAKLDMDNPASQYVLDKVAKGKRFAFSIEGSNPIVRHVYSENLGKEIEEFINVTPTAISITTEPSYIPSFAEVIRKSAKNLTEKLSNDKNNILIKNNNMEDTKVTEVEKEEVKVEEKSTEISEDTKLTETKEEVKDSSTEEAKAETTEDKTALESLEEVEKSVKKETTVVEKKEELKKSSEDDPEMSLTTIHKAISDMHETCKAIEKCIKSMQGQSENTEKSLKIVGSVMKSFHEEIEKFKNLPLAKKSLAKSTIEERVEDVTPKSVKDVVSSLFK